MSVTELLCCLGSLDTSLTHMIFSIYCFNTQGARPYRSIDAMINCPWHIPFANAMLQITPKFPLFRQYRWKMQMVEHWKLHAGQMKRSWEKMRRGSVHPSRFLMSHCSRRRLILYVTGSEKFNVYVKFKAVEIASTNCNYQMQCQNFIF